MFFSTFISAQTKVLQAKITNDEDVEGIHVLNTTSRYNAITDEYGNFSIGVKRKDTLVISSIAYYPEKIPISDEIFDSGFLTITLTKLINELDEVVLGNNLSGNIATDLKNIKTEKDLNFDDVGIPGFKGIPEEKIVPIVPYFGLATALDIEAMYKHISGYYKKLKIKRKWEAQNMTAAQILSFYGHQFFLEAYNIPKERMYDFMLFCIETSDIQDDFKKENFANVLQILESKSLEYLSRIIEPKE
ncbi:hypothetical protein BXY75_2583 [Ulvibacter antarcticus]|uniref:Carboxypeptidase-like protein n=1 Tax=Ulvibacter antarcticus TaxID=442714 RepID=A0A3L9YIL8_9FLAO|nr:hypothetical protein BXY75_2583 [Ulvibacter antarcticus]